MSTQTVFDDSMALQRPHSRISVGQPPRGWTDGAVFTCHGIVLVYAQGDDEYTHHTRLDFVWQGRLYMRDFNGKRYSPRGLVTLADRFAAEIVESQE
jgi:hypothetical protein